MVCRVRAKEKERAADDGSHNERCCCNRDALLLFYLNSDLVERRLLQSIVSVSPRVPREPD